MATTPFLLPLDACIDPTLVGGKAAGLGQLIRNGFRVPPGVCVTTAAYRHSLHRGGFDLRTQWEQVRRASGQDRVPLLDECRRRVGALVLPDEIRQELVRQLAAIGTEDGTRWAVRSSCSEEDAAGASFGGLFQTSLGVTRDNLPAAIVECWTSLWRAPVWIYGARAGKGGRLTAEPPAMAVVLQPLLAARSAGVVYSQHPVTGVATQVVINAVHGLGEPLASGESQPDHYVVEVQADRTATKVIERAIPEKERSRVMGPAGLVDQPLAESLRRAPVLEDRDVTALARLAKQVEEILGRPADIEWAIDAQGLWLLQARPITVPGGQADLAVASCIWSRANFRETLPDVPSPLAVALLEEYMETCILQHYREVGCHIPRGLPSVRVMHGRPYINVTLMQSLMAQLGGDPAEVTDLMGGEPLPPVPGVTRLPWWRLVRAGILIQRKFLKASRRAPAWFAEMKRLGQAQAVPELDGLTERELLARLLALNPVVRAGDITFALVGKVSRSLMVLRITLQRRLQGGWRPLLNAATRGIGTIISAKQIFWLFELAELAREDRRVRDFLLVEPWQPEAFRVRVAGTAFLGELDRFLAEYGHRAIGESDIRSTRFAEEPDYVLGIIRGHLLAPAFRSSEAAHQEQAHAREAAMWEIRKAFAWRLPEWLWFRWWHRELCRAQELREANRHHLMHYLAGVKRLFVILGRKLENRGLLASPDDLFFLVPDEIRTLVADLPGAPRQDWKSLIARRRKEMAHHAAGVAPDVVASGPAPEPSESASGGTESTSSLKGMPISGGYAEGPVRVILSPEALGQVRRGDVLVVPVIDPGMAPLMGLAAALVVEMGGMLSHGAIIAREYGIPAVANVRQATRLLKEGERVAVDAGKGEVRRLAGQ